MGQAVAQAHGFGFDASDSACRVAEIPAPFARVRECVAAGEIFAVGALFVEIV
jgi:hypothetical protein